MSTVAVVTSVSSKIGGLAMLTMPNKFEYCLRHGYTLIADYLDYESAVCGTHLLCHYLDRYEMVWTLDCDAIVTNMATPIHALDCLGPHVTACEEGIVDWNRLNCGSVVWRNTPEARGVLNRISDSRHEWQFMPCQWQTWLGMLASDRPDIVTTAPLRAFNSCVWNRPANARDEIGGHWQPGDFVYHPCGVFPHEEKVRWIERTLPLVDR